MKVQLERAAEAFLTERLVLATALQGVDFVWDVRAGTKEGDLPDDRHTVVCIARETQRMRNLRDYDIDCRLSSPATATSPDSVSAMQQAIEEAWEATLSATTPNAAWSTALATHLPGWLNGGLYPGRSEEESDENHWMWGYVITAGVVREGI